MVKGTLSHLPTESQKKKQNQDDSDDDDDDEAGPSFQQPTAQPQAAYAPPMTQAGMPPVPAAPGMPPGSYAGKFHTTLFMSSQHHCNAVYCWWRAHEVEFIGLYLFVYVQVCPPWCLVFLLWCQECHLSCQACPQGKTACFMVSLVFDSAV